MGLLQVKYMEKYFIYRAINFLYGSETAERTLDYESRDLGAAMRVDSGTKYLDDLVYFLKETTKIEGNGRILILAERFIAFETYSNGLLY